MGLMSWILVGGISGWIASKFMGTDASMGIVANIIVGIIGAFIGGGLFSFLGGSGVTGFNLYSFIVATIGASVFIYIVKSIKK